MQATDQVTLKVKMPSPSLNWCLSHWYEEKLKLLSKVLQYCF